MSRIVTDRCEDVVTSGTSSACERRTNEPQQPASRRQCMATQIVAVSLSGGTNYEHIVRLYWMDGNAEKYSTREQMVEYIEGGGQAFTQNQQDRAYCEVVSPPSGPKYVRTKPDSTTGNNLLSLPRR
jgi:hypothetical protein